MAAGFLLKPLSFVHIEKYFYCDKILLMNFTYGPRKFLKLFTILSFLIASSAPAFSKVTSYTGSDVKLH